MISFALDPSKPKHQLLGDAHDAILDNRPVDIGDLIASARTALKLIEEQGGELVEDRLVLALLGLVGAKPSDVVWAAANYSGSYEKQLAVGDLPVPALPAANPTTQAASTDNAAPIPGAANVATKWQNLTAPPVKAAASAAVPASGVQGNQVQPVASAPVAPAPVATPAPAAPPAAAPASAPGVRADGRRARRR